MAGRLIRLGAGIRGRSGEWSENEYTRSLPGHPEGIASICKKPHYTKAQKKKMAQRPQVQRFCAVNKEASEIMHNPVLKAEWEERHKAFRREASRHREYEYPRLWDFIRHMLNKEKSETEKGIQK